MAKNKNNNYKNTSSSSSKNCASNSTKTTSSGSMKDIQSEVPDKRPARSGPGGA